MWFFFPSYSFPKEMVHCLGINFFCCYQFFAMLVLRSCLEGARNAVSYMPILESQTLNLHVQEIHKISKCKHWEVQREVMISPVTHFLLYTSNLKANIRKSIKAMEICIKVELQKWILWLSLMKIPMDISPLHLNSLSSSYTFISLMFETLATLFFIISQDKKGSWHRSSEHNESCPISTCIIKVQFNNNG